MNVYITKYWQTKGIIQRQVKVGRAGTDMVCTVDSEWTEYFHKPYWHESLQEAKAHAELLRLKKIRSMQKTLAKLEKLSFV